MMCGGEDPLFRKTGNEGLRLRQGRGPLSQRRGDCGRGEVRFASGRSHWHPEGTFLCILQESAPRQVDEGRG